MEVIVMATNFSQYIAFRNGILNLKTRELLPFNKDYVVFNKINWDYNPHAYTKDVDIMLNEFSCNDSQTRRLLEELFGCVMCRNCERQPIFLITGKDEDSQVLFLLVLERLMGENCSVLPIRSLIADKRKTTLTYMSNKLLNICRGNTKEIMSRISKLNDIAYAKLPQHMTLILVPYPTPNNFNDCKVKNIKNISFNRKPHNKVFAFDNISPEVVGGIRQMHDCLNYDIDIFMSHIINLGLAHINCDN